MICPYDNWICNLKCNIIEVINGNTFIACKQYPSNALGFVKVSDLNVKYLGMITDIKEESK